MSLRWLSAGEREPPAGDDWLTPRERSYLARMRFPKRSSEFRLGRWTAKRALAFALGVDPCGGSLARIEIDRATDGAPEPRLDGEPAPVAISMTDRAGWAVCVVGEPGTAVGCDLELVEPRSTAFVSDYLTPDEQRFVGSARSREESDVRANLLWSAKEAALKVLRTGLRRDTRSVEVRVLDEAGGAGWAALEVRDAGGPVFPGWWRRYGVFLLTVAADVALPPPVPIVEPPGLATAEPSELWRLASFQVGRNG